MEAKFLLTGDCSLSVQMGEEISLAVNQRVRMLFLNLTTCPIEGVREMVPTYASLMIHYQPEVLRFEVLKAEIVKRLDHLDSAEKENIADSEYVPYRTWINSMWRSGSYHS